MLTPTKSIRNFRFCTLAGVKEAALEGSNIVGRFRSELQEFYGPPRHKLIEEFLNWPDDNEGILRFTRKYGPVLEYDPLRPEPVSNGTFEFPVVGWKVNQQFFRDMWARMRRFPDWQPQGGTLAFRNGQLIYTAPNLYMFLYMDLVTSDTKRLRICKRPDCPNRYFIAGDLKQRFCSTTCAEWGQRELKKRWWNEHGEAWRAEKRRQKGSKDGSKKTR